MAKASLIGVNKSYKAGRAWQRMLSGRRLDLLNPSPFDIELEDIAHGLSRMSRWNGQTTGEHSFSVAAHSLLVLEIFTSLNPNLTPKQAMMVLLHDAPEYVMGDLISPFKAAIGASYKDLEQRLLNAIYLRFTLPAPAPKELEKLIKQADLAAAALEAHHLAGFEAEEVIKLWGKLPPALAKNPKCHPLHYLKSNGEIKKIFIDKFHELECPP